MNKPVRPDKKETKIKCLQGQMKEGEKDIDCTSYPRGMKNEVLAHHQAGYMRGMCIGVDQCHEAHTPLVNWYEERIGKLVEALEDER